MEHCFQADFVGNDVPKIYRDSANITQFFFNQFFYIKVRYLESLNAKWSKGSLTQSLAHM